MHKSYGNAEGNARDILIRDILRELGRLYHLFVPQGHRLIITRSITNRTYAYSEHKFCFDLTKKSQINCNTLRTQY